MRTTMILCNIICIALHVFLHKKCATKLHNKKLDLFLQSFNLNSNKNEFKNMVLPPLYQKVARKRRNLIIMEYLDMVGLKDWAIQTTNELSGRQKQRVAVTRSLITKQKIILADEPTGALDSKTTVDEMNLLLDENHSEMTMIIVTHEPSVANATGKIVHIKMVLLKKNKSKVKKNIVFFLYMLFVVQLCCSQGEPQLWMLRRCIEYALQNNVTIKQIEQVKERKEVNLDMRKKNRLPSVNAYIGQNIDAGRSPSKDGTIKDQSSTNSSFYIQISMPLFEGLKLKSEIKAQGWNVLASIERLHMAKIDVSIFLLELMQVMNLEVEDWEFNIVVPTTERIVSYFIKNILSPDMICDEAILFKPQIKAQNYLLKSSIRTLDITRSGYFPRLSFNASYGNYYYYYHYHYTDYENASFSDQLNQNSRKAIGLTLSIPIFNRFQVRNNVRSEQIAINSQKLAIEDAGLSKAFDKPAKSS